MIEKIRLHSAGNLWPDLHENLGQGSDLACLDFLHVNYDDLKVRVLAGDSDEDILHWCQERTRPLNETDKRVWNFYITKLGWNDHVTAMLTKRKSEGGLADRDDIQTMAHFIDVDEGRLV